MRARAALLAALVLLVASPAPGGQWFAEDEAKWFEFWASLQRQDDEEFQKLGFEPIEKVQAAGRKVRRLYFSNAMEGDFALEAERLADGKVRLIVFVREERRVDAILGPEVWARITQNEDQVFPPRVFKPSPPGTPPPPPAIICHASYSAFSTGTEGVRHQWYYCQTGDRSPEVVSWMRTLEEVAGAANGCPPDGLDYMICFDTFGDRMRDLGVIQK